MKATENQKNRCGPSVFGYSATLLFLLAGLVSRPAAAQALPAASIATANGGYNGLFYETNAAQPSSSGFIHLEIDAAGSFDGSVNMEDDKYNFAGKFDSTGLAEFEVQRGKDDLPLTIELQLDFAGRKIFGLVTDGNWISDLFADHVYDAGQKNTNAGVYNLVLPGGDFASGSFGDGYLTLAVDNGGFIYQRGLLADNTSTEWYQVGQGPYSPGMNPQLVNQTSASDKISQNGLYAFYSKPYDKGQGVIFGWIIFINQPVPSLGGELMWFRSPNAKRKFYPAGITNQISAFGFPFDDSLKGNKTREITNGTVTLAGGNLPPGQIYTVDLADKAANTNHVKLQWHPNLGWMRGTFIHPVTHRPTKLWGVYVQEPNQGRGFFLGTNESGSFRLQP